MGSEYDSNEKRLDAQVCAALERGKGWLHFPPALEERFELDRSSSRSLHLRGAVLIAAVIYDLFLFCDFRFIPEHFLRCLMLRLALVTPLTFGMYFWLKFNPPKRLRESMILAVSCVVGFITLYLWHGVSGVATTFSETALILLILFVNAMMRLSFRYALASTSFCVINGAAFLYRDPWLTGPEKSTCIALVGTAVVFILAANCWMEREERLGYLLRVQVELRGRELSFANEELTRLSNLDALTGLPNRRYFSMRFGKAWEEARRSQSPLSLLLIDIDRFKRINDEYGHLYGDETLVRLSVLLRQALHSEEDVVARYGGDEFVILLPGLALDEAAIIAERLRKLTRTMDLAAQEGLIPAATTISVGIASAVPGGYQQPEELLRDADLALYRAKTHGRNRVWRAAKAAEGTCQFAPGPQPLEHSRCKCKGGNCFRRGHCIKEFAAANTSRISPLHGKSENAIVAAFPKMVSGS